MHGGRHRPGPHRARARGDRVRRVEPAHRGDGRRDHPAHARGAPDDRRRADRRCSRRPATRSAYPIIRDMDTFCYERQTGGLDGGGLVRPPPDLPPARRHPVDRGVAPVADRAAVHRRRLRPAARRGARADARHPRRPPRSSTRSTACCRSRPTASRCSARRAEVRNLWSAAAVWIKEGPGRRAG